MGSEGDYQAGEGVMQTEDEWYEALRVMAEAYDENVSDRAAWVEDFYDGLTPQESFFGEYPEHNPQGLSQ